MALSRSRKRWLIILGSLFMLLVLLTVSANLILSNKAESILREQLGKAELKDQVVDFEKVRINIFTRSVTITGITLVPDSSALENVKRSNLAKPLVELKLEKIRVSGIKILKALRGDGFSLGKIILDEPLIVIYGNGSPFKGKGNNNGGSNIFSSDKVVESPVEEARLNNLRINEARIRYIDLAANKTLIESSGLNINLDDIWVHYPDGDTLSHALDLGDVNLNLDSVMLDLPGGFYTLKTGEFELSYKDGALSLDALELIPAYAKGTFGKKFGKQTDRFDITAGKISIEGIVFDSLLKKKFIATEILLNSPHADICRDKRVARDMSIFPKLFQTALADLPIKVYVPLVKVSNGLVNYQEIVHGADQPGGVIISDLELEISGACNYEDSIENGQALLVNANGQLMEKTALQASFYLPIGNHAEYFTFHGSTSTFPASNLNPLIAPLAYVEATGGTINSNRFYAMAMNDTTAGRIEFKYQDLEVAVLKKKKENEGIVQENKFVSFLARTAMHKNNPNQNKPVRIAKMSFVRDRNKGFFNYVWKTIQDGLIVTLTPGKKRLASDMDWNEFSTKWRKVLLNDWNEIQNHQGNKKK